jgi:protocatechuate 3,4-dioxygenase alpha subunit
VTTGRADPRLATTPSQTVGPFLHIGLSWEDGEYVVADGAPGAVVVSGHVFDGNGEPVPDGMVETWQADPDGRFPHPDDPRGARRYEGFRGFGRAHTQADGSWRIVTLKPGVLPTAEGGQEAPHLDVSLFARGLLNRVVTRIYFDDEGAANAADPVLRSVPSDRVSTLVAHRKPVLTGSARSGTPVAGAPVRVEYVIDLVLQGENETVFFAV